MSETYYFVKDLINELKRGRIRIPSFQRGFVWNPEQVLYFIDSIYKGFPFGSVLLWRTKNPLRTERSLGPYKLPINDPEYPIDYVLDGQQRITSIFGIFQDSLVPEDNQPTNWTNLFFELNSQDSVPFKYLDNPDNYDSKRFFPLKYVFDSPRYRQRTRHLEDDIAEQIDDLVDRFTNAKIPIERFANEEKKYVATVFERINRQKVDLDTLDLLSVWNWSEDFDLQEKLKGISEDLEPFKFKDIGSDLLLKCCSAVIINSSKPEAFIDLRGSEVREKFDEIKNGIFNAIDCLKTDFKVFSLKLLPMENILVVLTAFFASPQKQRSPMRPDEYRTLKKWFWRSCFSQRYATGGSKSTDVDLEEVQKLKKGQPSKLGDFDFSIDANYFISNTFRMSTVATNSFILLLAQNQPRNFIQESEISLEDVLSIGNRKEFHHIFPKAYLGKRGISKDKEINCLANFCILSRTDNNTIKDQPPHEYRDQMTQDLQQREIILNSHFLSSNMFDANYYDFLKLRAKLLLNKVEEITK